MPPTDTTQVQSSGRYVGAAELNDVRECIGELAACKQNLSTLLDPILRVDTQTVGSLISEISYFFISSIRQDTLSRKILLHALATKV